MPKPSRVQRLLDGLIFTAPRLTQVLGGKTNFHAENSFHAETSKLHVSLISLRNCTLVEFSTPKPAASCTAPRQNSLRSHACRQRPRFLDFP